MYLIYNFLLLLASPWIIIRSYKKTSFYKQYRQRFKERFGKIPELPTQGIWIHAASVGETIAASPMVKALKKQYPDIPIYFTNITYTGADRAATLYVNQANCLLAPFDFPCGLKRFLNKLQPKLLLLVESELWPNMINQCFKKNIPIVLVNGRLSPRSYQRHKCLQYFSRQLLQKLSRVAAQSELDFERFKNLGVEPQKLSLTGNLKFAVQLPEDLVQKGQTWRTQLGQNRLIWVAASTHPVEDEIVLQAHQIIVKAYPDSLLILVPRHPERFDKVFELCQKEGFNTLRRSLNKPASLQTQIFLGDTMGELLQFYQTANVAFVGGSLVPVGGHSLLEPAAVGVPIIAGPHLFNTTEIAEQLSKVNALISIIDAQTLSAAVIELFRDEEKRKQMVNQARSIVVGNQDSLPKTLTIVNQFL